MSYVIIETEGGVIDIVTTEFPETDLVLIIDYDEIDPHYDGITDPTTVADNILELLNGLRQVVPPGKLRKRLRSSIVDRWHDFDYIVKDGIATEREDIDEREPIRSVAGMTIAELEAMLERRKAEATNLVRQVDNIDGSANGL